jgi:TonB family protein
MWAVAMSLSMVAAGGQAQTASAVRKTVESTVLVTGEIQIAADGHVDGYSVDQQDKLPSEALQLLGQALPAWTFEPIERDGARVAARSRMTVRLVARKVEDGYQMSVRSAEFGGDPAPGETIAKVRMDPPTYPMSAARSGASGTVFLLIEVGRDGRVLHADAAQTNLTVVSNARDMASWRTLFEKSAVNAARAWTFAPPTVGNSAAAASWVIRVPVQYAFKGMREEGYGKWEVYIPGPRNPVPWMSTKVAADRGLDAGMDGQLTQVGYGPQLQTPLDAG